MEAKVEVKDGVYVINLSGHMDFESADSLKSECLRKFTNSEVIFNLDGLNFVGSSGISPFLDLLSEMSQALGARFKICNVGTEFLRLFESGATEGIQIYRDVQEAHRSFHSHDVQALALLKPFGLKLTID